VTVGGGHALRDQRATSRGRARGAGEEWPAYRSAGGGPSAAPARSRGPRRRRPDRRRPRAGEHVARDLKVDRVRAAAARGEDAVGVRGAGPPAPGAPDCAAHPTAPPAGGSTGGCSPRTPLPWRSPAPGRMGVRGAPCCPEPRGRPLVTSRRAARRDCGARRAPPHGRHAPPVGVAYCRPTGSGTHFGLPLGHPPRRGAARLTPA
jgi:hypothetical protein